MSKPQHDVKLLMDYVDGVPVYEAVPAIEIGENRYRLTSSPGFAPGVASGDEIELAAVKPFAYRVIKRGGNICIQLFLTRLVASDRKAIAGKIESIGGKIDGGKDGVAGHLLIFNVPIATGFAPIEKVMEEISRDFAVERWMYGNVYDTRDGATPLNWWLKPKSVGTT